MIFKRMLYNYFRRDLTNNKLLASYNETKDENNQLKVAIEKTKV